MKFSQRIGKTELSKTIQLEMMDDDLRNGLWNSYWEYIKSPLNYNLFEGVYYKYVRSEYFKLTIDKHYDIADYVAEIREFFFNFYWFEVYDFLEFHAKEETEEALSASSYDFIKECNRIMEREFSGYRFIDRIITPVSSQVEIEAISEALISQDKFEGVSYHLREAMVKLSDKKAPDYRNSIKESISAIEALCREVTGENTLGKALKKLEVNGIVINPQLKSGIENIYNYTNHKETGIRHALMESPNLPTFDDAKFMLVICSGFVNFVKGKMVK